MLSRRGFLSGAVGASTLVGCRWPFASSGRRRYADYWCTFETQCKTKKVKAAQGAVRFAGDQGGLGDRDNLNEEILFGRDGWVNLFPEIRKDLVFLLDDGWDVPYGADGGEEGIAAFGSHTPDSVKFPALRGTTAEKLARLDARVRDTGWMGTGVWVAPQMTGERYGAPCKDWTKLEEDLKRKLSESAEGNIAYWKVDWGVHNRDVRYRRLMSELKDRYAPDLLIDHCWGVDNALNGRPYPYVGWKKPDALDVTGGDRCRMTDNPLYDGVRKDYESLMAFSDIFRTYDTLFPMCVATALDRAVFEIECADHIGSRTIINTEDEDLLAATLGMELAMMRAPVWPRPEVVPPWNRGERMTEAIRCVNWHRLAPPFGSDRGIRLLRSERRLEENWYFRKGSTWWTAVYEREIRQTAPAVVTRGLPLPEVRSLETDGELPFVTAGRNPSGAKSVAAVPLVTQSRGFHTPRAAVMLDAALAEGEPLGVFGAFGELTVITTADPSAHVVVRDLAGGPEEDITAATVRAGNRMTWSGDLLRRIGTRQNPAGDPSSPGLVIELV